MCFILDKNSKELVAEKDIKCYKVGRIIRDPVAKRKVVFESEYFFHCYRKDNLNEEVKLNVNEEDYILSMTMNPSISRKAIHAGYHSYKSIRAVYDGVPFPGVTQIISEVLTLAEFVIPKGSTYYENQYEYASSNIIFKETISANTFKKIIRTF